MGKTDENKVLSNGEFKKQQKERKNKLKKSLRKKENKKRGRKDDDKVKADDVKSLLGVPEEKVKNDDVVIEYIDTDAQILTGRNVSEFKHVFEHFNASKKEEEKKADVEVKPPPQERNPLKLGFIQANYETLPENVATASLSKKKLKQLKRMKVAELKQIVKRSDVVEVWDVTASDPVFLIWLKSYRNSVPVSKHWSQKRKYLQYKRGVQKAPFNLPEYIEATGISRLRNTINNDPGKNIRQKMRERMNPKLGKMDIDYQILHDAFFKYQTKSKLTIHGDIYYEGKEYEVKMRVFKPGRVSPDLRQALGIPENSPPPWLINMQRYGPPPSYPNLKIPGVNAPIPDTITFGWGKLFTDMRGFTVYADCHGLTKPHYEGRKPPILHNHHWGEVKEEEEEDEEEEEEEESSASEREERPVELRSGISSVLSGLETPEVDIRKVPLPDPERNIQNIHEMSKNVGLYKVLDQYKTNVGGEDLFGSSIGYSIPKDNIPGQEDLSQIEKAREGIPEESEEKKKQREKEKAKKNKNFKF